jgi:hypothetical protein
MAPNPLKSLEDYNRFVAGIIQRSSVSHCTVTVWSDSRFTGIAEGDVSFSSGFRLRVREELDFDAGLITSYGYEVYRGKERIYWYDDFPHPNDPNLAETFPHHKHIEPDIKHHRIRAPELSFSKPNLPYLIEEIEERIDD